MGKLLLAVSLMAVLLVSNQAIGASPQVAASQALSRDATKLRRAIEATCTNPVVTRTSFQLESTTRLLTEKIERQRCESEVSPLMYECIDLYNSLVSYVERDYRLATNPQVVTAMQCTATQLNKTADALRQYQARPVPVVPALPQPSWSTGRLPPAPIPYGQPPVFREYSIPRQHFEHEHAPIQINRHGGYQNYPNSQSPFSNGYRDHITYQELGGAGVRPQPQAFPNQSPRIGQMILERVLREALR